MNYAPYEITPIEAVESIKPFIQGKSVYDLGAGYGDFALAMKQYATQVIAIEDDDMLAIHSRKRGVQTIIEDFLDVDLSKAEVIYIFMSFYGTMMLTKKLLKEDWHGTVISHYYPLHLNIAEPMKPDEFINEVVPFLIYHL